MSDCYSEKLRNAYNVAERLNIAMGNNFSIIPEIIGPAILDGEIPLISGYNLTNSLGKKMFGVYPVEGKAIIIPIRPFLNSEGTIGRQMKKSLDAFVTNNPDVTLEEDSTGIEKTPRPKRNRRHSEFSLDITRIHPATLF